MFLLGLRSKQAYGLLATYCVLDFRTFRLDQVYDILLQALKSQNLVTSDLLKGTSGISFMCFSKNVEGNHFTSKQSSS